MLLDIAMIAMGLPLSLLGASVLTRTLKTGTIPRYSRGRIAPRGPLPPFTRGGTPGLFYSSVGFFAACTLIWVSAALAGLWGLFSN